MEQLKSPSELKLSGNVEDHWKRFTLYQTAIGATEESNEQMTMTAGPEALDVSNSLHLTADEQKNYAMLIGKFELFCTPKHMRGMFLTTETRWIRSQFKSLLLT